MKRMAMLAVLGAGALTYGGCNLDLQDPNLPTEEAQTSTREGVAQIAVGLQAEYGNQLIDPVYVTGLVTNELGAGGATFQSFQIADSGDQPLDNDLGPSENPWEGQYLVVRDANVLLEHAPQVGFGPGTTSGILALAELFKAMAYGNLIQIYQQIPLQVGPDNPQPQFATREEVFAEIEALLQSAQSRLQAQPASSEFEDQILAPGFDLENTIDAMLARYALIAGDDQLAAQSAQAVDLNVLSEFEFSASDPNPLYGMWYASGNAYQLRPKDIFRLQAESGDRRVDYFVVAFDLQGAVSPLDSLVRYNDLPDPYPAYFPDEMRLIRAEVLARAGDLPGALALVNEVRTRCSSPLDVPNACLPALTLADLSTQQAMLDQILYERRYSLYLQGVRWSDLRRFDVTPKFDWMSVPRSECDRNPNVPSTLCGASQPNA